MPVIHYLENTRIKRLSTDLYCVTDNRPLSKLIKDPPMSEEEYIALNRRKVEIRREIERRKEEREQQRFYSLLGDI